MSPQGQLIQINQALKSEKYVCPTCGQKLVIKTSCLGKKYFGHLQRSSKLCGESTPHQLGKQQIFQWALSQGWHPKLEVYLPNIHQRPDILIEVKQKQIAVEYQCSPLTIDQMKQRNQGYDSQGICVKWILGHRYCRHLHARKVAQFTQRYQNQVCLYFWDSKSQRIIYRSNFATSSFRANIGSKAERILKQTNRLQSNRFITNPLTNFCYQNGHLVGCCPLFVHDLIKRWPVMVTPVIEWRIRTLLIMEKWPIGKSLSLGTWQQWLFFSADWLEFPCLDERMIEQLRYRVILDWQEALVMAGIIQINNLMVHYCSCPIWYNNITEKNTEIKQLASKTGRLFQRMIK